jgi:hypothetical protein
MKKTALFLFIAALISCNNNKKEQENNTKLIWSESFQTTLPLETDTIWDGSDLTNAASKFDKEKIYSSIISGILSGKLKAYRNYPEESLSIDDVKHVLVQWDSTAYVEDVNNPGTFISAPIKMEISAFRVPQIKFHEKIELDTISYSINKRVSYITLYTYRATETGNVKGIMKMFDVKLNDEQEIIISK